eukprot:m.60604 g.60604  ORF g.60604 m.60604 type:complete len:92 (+) comp9515_c0_seq1:7411-7686(+)
MLRQLHKVAAALCSLSAGKLREHLSNQGTPQRCRSTASFNFAAATLFCSLAATAGPTTARFSVSSPTSRLLQNHGFRIRGCRAAVDQIGRI